MPKIINLLSYHIAENVEKMIYENHLSPGTKLPSERELAKIHNLNRITLRRGLQRLIDDGVIYNVPNNGYFVAPKRIYREGCNLFFPQNDKLLDLDNYDVKPISLVTLFSDYSNGVDPKMNIQEKTINSYIEYVNNIPISISLTIQNNSSLIKYPNLFNSKKPTNLVQKQTTKIYYANSSEMELLEITPNDSLFIVSESIYDNDELIAVCESICVGTRCEIQLEVLPKPIPPDLKEKL